MREVFAGRGGVLGSPRGSALVAAQRRSRVRALVWRSCASLASSRSVAMAAERERVRQMELESERLREVVETLEIRLRAARADHAKELAEARFEVSSANERARQARTRADALEEALAGGARPARELASSVGASPLSSPLHSPRGARPDDALASRPARRGVADAVADLVTWRAPGKSARVLGLGLYLQLCVSSLRSMPLPFWTVFCYGAIFSLAASLAWRIFRRFRRGLAPHARAVAADAVALADARRAREASVRRVAAKLGGWVASSAASRAPLAAESWIALERCVAWEHPPTTLKACATLWLVSLVARVWWLPASTTACVLWVGAFVVPPRSSPPRRRRGRRRERRSTNSSRGSRTCSTIVACSWRRWEPYGRSRGTRGVRFWRSRSRRRFSRADRTRPERTTDSARDRRREEVSSSPNSRRVPRGTTETRRRRRCGVRPSGETRFLGSETTSVRIRRRRDSRNRVASPRVTGGSRVTRTPSRTRERGGDGGRRPARRATGRTT